MKFIYLSLLLALSWGLGAQESPQTAEQELAQSLSEPELDSNQYFTRAPLVLDGDSLFTLYENISGFSATTRAQLANKKLVELMNGEAYFADSLHLVFNEPYYQIYYGSDFILNISKADAAWFGKGQEETALEYLAILQAKTQSIVSGIDLQRLFIQIALALLVIVVSYFIIRYVNRFFRYTALRIHGFKGVYLNGISIGNYEFITEDRMLRLVLIANNILRIITIFLIFYLTLPILFSIFPWTEGLATTLFDYILNPVKKTVFAIIDYIPNLFTILVIFFVVRWITNGVKFMASEVEEGKLKITNFYPDWAVPTARIINFLLYAFMLVMIWPYLPGSHSDIFKGVSVFIGLLISLGSSSAISNIVSGLVITYMRPFKLGDRVSVGDTTGDVIEKNLLVTRIKTIKNEIITLPNSTILSNSSINFSQSSNESQGLVVHTTVTIGYDVPWRQVHAMLIEAAVKTPLIEEVPAPFVLQTSLDDFYISYQVNAFTRQPQSQAVIYSDLHALIQDVFAANDVEIMSPHYRAERPGPSTIPPSKQNGGTDN